MPLTYLTLAFTTSEWSKSKLTKSDIGQKDIVAQFISQHPYTLGSCSFGSKLIIHTVSQGLNAIDLPDTCLFYLGGVKVKVDKSEIVQNYIVAQFISQHPYTLGSCSFGSKLSIHIVSQGLSDLRV